MRRPHLFTRLYAGYLVVIILSTAALGLLAVRSAHTFYISHTESDLQARAQLVQAQIGDQLSPANASSLEALVTKLGTASGTRITVIARDGTVLAESDLSPAGMENHADRPEVKTAFAGRVGRDIRFSTTLNENLMYVAIPVRDASGVAAVIRTAIPLTTVNEALDSLYRRIVVSAVVVALVAALIALYVSRRLSRQMRVISAGAEAFAAGDLSHKLLVPKTEEFARVAESLNRMAAELNEKVRSMTRERNEREAVLSSMVEGVVAVDGEERVIAVNEAAATLLGITPAEAVGCTIQEVVRNPELQGFVAKAVTSAEPVEGEMGLRVGHDERVLQAHGTVLRGAAGGLRGAVVVLNDITRLKRLEGVRRDFVANVSHELKTPVTSIKGFAETLLDGALEERDDAARFVRIIAGQADRLNSIIEDLLSVSALEMSDEGRPIVREEGSIDDVLHVAAEVCAAKAEAKNITLELEGLCGHLANINPPLLEQAVVNLVDNAIKYSPAGSSVQVGCEVADGELAISVRDRGPGIAREHLPRLFERFYRVDKARSRDLGGTGLGLAIVKHIAQAHGGRVSVESTPGQGSTFRIHLPLD